MAKILFVDDDSSFTSATKVLLTAAKHSVETADSVKSAKQAMQKETFDIVFLDLSLPDGSGLELVQDDGPKAVIITGHPSVETAIHAVRGRVVDYLVKPVDKDQLLRTIESALPNIYSGASNNSELAFETALVGESEAMQKLYHSISEYGPTDITILVTGESGTGKDLIATALHDVREKSEPFVPINCGAIPAELISSELFGHEKGSFTGAAAQRNGAFERAKKGTVFLDEIGELPLSQQVALLRVIENRTVIRVGGEKEIPISARFIAATNKDLAKEVEAGNFREDLYYRLMVLPIKVPPLRERKGDVALLTQHFLKQFANDYKSPTTVLPSNMKELEKYHWPGNVRELKHTILRAAITNRNNDQIEILPENFNRPPNWSKDQEAVRPGMSIKVVERNLIEKTLEHYGGNKSQTADALGISLKTLYNRLDEYGNEDE